MYICIYIIYIYIYIIIKVINNNNIPLPLHCVSWGLCNHQMVYSVYFIPKFVLSQNCLSEYLLYNAVVNTSATKKYYGICKKSFKERCHKHMSSFRNKSCQKNTGLSNYIWEMIENYQKYTIDWLIPVKAHPYICATRKCDLCLCEKLLTARANLASLLNKRDELVSKCRHMNEFTLKCLRNR